MNGTGLRALPPGDVYVEDGDVRRGMNREYSPYTDDGFSNCQHVLIAVIELAVKDCRYVFEKPPDRGLTDNETINAISAARFFLSKTGDEYMEACGFGKAGLKVARKLGMDTLRAIGIRPKDVFNTSSKAWKVAVGTVNQTKWTKTFLRSNVFVRSRQGTFRPFLLAA